MGWVSKATTRRLYPQERDPVPIVYRRWVGTSAGLEGCGKFRPATEFDLRTEQPVASRYSWTRYKDPNVVFLSRFMKLIRFLIRSVCKTWRQWIVPKITSRFIVTRRLEQLACEESLQKSSSGSETMTGDIQNYTSLKTEIALLIW